jgi:hypothetical protein
MKYLITLFAIALSFPSAAQDTISKPQLPNFFLDCQQCDFNFIREELPFVSFVREPQSADIHILVTTSNTASGGHMYFLNFIGLKGFENTNYEYEVVTSQANTDDETRNALLKMLKVGILGYYSRTSFIDNLKIDIEESANRKAESMVIDRWNKWFFRISSGAEFQKEKSQNEYSIETSASASRITDKWKTQFFAGYELNRENFYDEGDLITNEQDSREFSAQIVKSITEKWSTAAIAGYESRTFLNIKNNYKTGVGIQYNVFPWKECNRRVLSIAYLLGIDGYQYNEMTIYEKMSEYLPAELAIVELEFIQPWGEVNVVMQGQHYFRDFSKNRLTIESDFEIRLSKNFSVFSSIEAQLIHDQLYLPKGDASLEDILLRRRKLATTYEIAGHLGLRFTFGSIFNNVVNERFKMD